jgi:hypothetical protein
VALRSQRWRKSPDYDVYPWQTRRNRPSQGFAERRLVRKFGEDAWFDKGRRFKTPRGLTSNRHAGRPDRQTVRAFAFRTGLLTNFMAPLRWRNERALPIFYAP